MYLCIETYITDEIQWKARVFIMPVEHVADMAADSV